MIKLYGENLVRAKGGEIPALNQANSIPLSIVIQY